MSLDTIMNLQITVESRAPSEAGFGTPLLFGYHTAWLDRRVKSYAEADDMLDDGFTADDALYKAAQAVKAQNPCPTIFKIGRRATALTQLITLTPTVTTTGFKYTGTIGGKALTYTVLAGATTTTIATALVGIINALSAGTTAANESAGFVVGSTTGPWALTSGATLLVAVDADVPASPDTATFTGVAAVQESGAGTFDLAGGKSLTVKIDGGAVQTISFVNGNFATPGAATAAEVVDVINAQIDGARATVTNTTKVSITSDKKGTGSHVEVTGGTANAALGFATSVADGSGNVASIAAVTFDEIKSIVEAATDAEVTLTAGGNLKLASTTTGTSSKLLVVSSSTADTALGLDNATHSGASGGATVTCTADASGVVVAFDLGPGIDVKDVTVDTTTDNELPVINDEDSDWYGLAVVDSSSKATALNVAGWIETQRKIATLQSADSEILDSNVVNDTFSALKDSSYARTNAIYHRPIGGVEWLAIGWQAGRLTSQPGSDTWAFKAVAGVKVDTLLQSAESAIEAKNGSHYTQTAGLAVTFEGHSGSGEYVDTTRFIDWVYARMRERVMGLLANNAKVPFTDSGVDMMRSALMSVIQEGITAGGFAATPEPTVTAPLVRDVPAASRIRRTLPDVNWAAHLAGAIHRMTPVRGRVTV